MALKLTPPSNHTSIHPPSIHLSSTEYPRSCHWGRRLSREAQTSLSSATLFGSSIDIVPIACVACPGFSLGPSTKETCPEHLNREVSGRDPGSPMVHSVLPASNCLLHVIFRWMASLTTGVHQGVWVLLPTTLRLQHWSAQVMVTSDSMSFPASPGTWLKLL